MLALTEAANTVFHQVLPKSCSSTKQLHSPIWASHTCSIGSDCCIKHTVAAYKVTFLHYPKDCRPHAKAGRTAGKVEQVWGEGGMGMGRASQGGSRGRERKIRSRKGAGLVAAATVES